MPQGGSCSTCSLPIIHKKKEEREEGGFEPAALMAPPRGSSSAGLFFIVLLSVSSQLFLSALRADAGAVFRVKSKFAGRDDVSIEEVRDHDRLRHERLLSAYDVHLTGDSSPDGMGIFYTDLQIGTPAQTYHVQIDASSNVFWVSCAKCLTCPNQTTLPFPLQRYDISKSTTGSVVGCEDDFCAARYGGVKDDCGKNKPCKYEVAYFDGTMASGSFVSDSVTYNKVTANMQSTPATATMIFGCSTDQSSQPTTGATLDGFLGLGQSNSSALSQLAAAGKSKKAFAHCLAGNKTGGGIFAIGSVVQPKVTKTPLVPDSLHYVINMKTIDVGGNAVKLPADTSGKRLAVLDSNSVMGFVPDDVLQAIAAEFKSLKPQYSIKAMDGFQCFPASQIGDGSGLPAITFHFADSLSMTVHASEYLFKMDTQLCLALQSSANYYDGKFDYIMGGSILANKLVVYDLENKSIGWTDYNCYSNITVADDETGDSFGVGTHTVLPPPAAAKSGAEMLKPALLFALGAFLQYML